MPLNNLTGKGGMPDYVNKRLARVQDYLDDGLKTPDGQRTASMPLWKSQMTEENLRDDDKRTDLRQNMSTPDLTRGKQYGILRGNVYEPQDLDDRTIPTVPEGQRYRLMNHVGAVKKRANYLQQQQVRKRIHDALRHKGLTEEDEPQHGKSSRSPGTDMESQEVEEHHVDDAIQDQGPAAKLLQDAVRQPINTAYKSAFDNTESIQFDSTDSSDSEGEEEQQALESDTAEPASQDMTRRALETRYGRAITHAQQQVGPLPARPARVNDAHKRLAAPAIGSIDAVLNDGDNHEDANQEHETDEENAGLQDTPTRARADDPVLKLEPRREKDAHAHPGPVVVPDGAAPLPSRNAGLAGPSKVETKQAGASFNRFTLNKNAVALHDPAEPKARSLPATGSYEKPAKVQPLAPAAPISSKVSAYAESSASDDNAVAADPLNASLDFPRDRLKAMTIADLDAIPFSTDPAAPAATGNLPLETRLANLSQMSEQEQAAFFASLSDHERAVARDFFVSGFAANAKKLMDIRLAKRKVALKYENEIKMRVKAVESKKEDVDAELRDLNAGGAALLGRRAG